MLAIIDRGRGCGEGEAVEIRQRLAKVCLGMTADRIEVLVTVCLDDDGRVAVESVADPAELELLDTVDAGGVEEGVLGAVQ